MDLNFSHLAVHLAFKKIQKNQKTTLGRRSLFHGVLWEPTCFCIKFNYLII